MLRIQTLGGLAVFDGERPLTGAAKQPKRLALLAMLARAGSRGVSRDRLLLMLWPDADEERARRGLNQALYALRQDLGEAAIAGSVDLRLDPSLITSDAQEFGDARAVGRFEAAAAAWRGPFLDGFNLPGLPEFERWAEAERGTLTHDYCEVLETLATQATARGDAVAAVSWWRKLAALDPHNGRIAESLMRALVAAGDAPGALRHAEIFNTLLDADLGLPPDRQITTLAERIRTEAAERPAMAARTPPLNPPPELPPVAEPVLLPPGAADVAEPEAEATSLTITSGWATVQLPAGATREPTPPAGQPRWSSTVTGSGDISEAMPRRRLWRRAWMPLAGVAAVVTVGLLVARDPGTAPPAAPATPSGTVVAVGRIADYTRSATGDRSAPLSDMLATNLARAAGLEVVSTSRMYELVAQLRRDGDSSDGAMARAARMAGATHLVDGALYEVSPGRLRLDLRRVEIASGSVKSAHTVEGTDLFVLADSGTRRIAADAGGTAASGSLASVTTASEDAYRLYDAGLRAYVRGERTAASELFRSALKEDSSFAMAAYYLSRASDELAEMLDNMERARRLSEHASPRERLTIRAAWAFLQNDPSFRAVAETLSIQFPNNLDGAYWFGQSLIREREYMAAVAPLQRVIRMDSLSLRGEVERCVACDAYQSLVFAYIAMDSLPGAEREVKRWIAAQPTSARAHDYLADILRLAGRTREAEQALQRGIANGLSSRDAWVRLATIAYHAEDYRRMDSILEAHLHQGTPPERWDAATELAISQRAQGRFNDAIRSATAGRQAFRGRSSEVLATRGVMGSLAEALSDAGRHGEALAVLDSASRLRDAREAPTSASRNLRYNLLQQSVFRWRMGDTTSLVALADSIEVLTSPHETRSRTLSAFPRALVALERGRPEEAVDLLRQIPTSPITGLGMVSYALGEALLAAQRPRDAVGVLQPLIRSYEGGPYLLTDYHEALARAWDAAGRADSARAHWAAVVRAWQRADPVLADRLAHAKARLAAR
ncbi:MAG TPA: BTAD domain-containing putative transcriptional regulator [Gemmatimonadales bacterium]|nr:BTAD domain-containing putative transcriptional regulator [Gemmatimonadales bacterium]